MFFNIFILLLNDAYPQLRWSYGVKLLSQADPEVREVEIDEHTPLLGEFERGGEYHYSQPTTSNSTSTGVDDDAKSPGVVVSQPSPYGMRPPPFRRTTFYNSFPNSPNHSRANLVQYDEISPSDVEGAELPSSNQRSDPRIAEGIKRRVVYVWMSFNDFMTAPLWASVASLIVAGIPPLQNWLQYNAQPIKGAISSAGHCSIPVTLVVLGAYFYPDPPESGNSTSNIPTMLTTSQSTSTLVGSVRGFFGKAAHTETSTSTTPRRGETKTVVISVISRMILTPLLLMPLITLSAKYDFHAVFEE